jgi:hypothetical protein
MRRTVYTKQVVINCIAVRELIEKKRYYASYIMLSLSASCIFGTTFSLFLFLLQLRTLTSLSVHKITPSCKLRLRKSHVESITLHLWWTNLSKTKRLFIYIFKPCEFNHTTSTPTKPTHPLVCANLDGSSLVLLSAFILDGQGGSLKCVELYFWSFSSFEDLNSFPCYPQSERRTVQLC